MKHRKFVKQLMAVGVSRNTAEEAAAAAARRGKPLYDTLGDLLFVRSLCNIAGLTTRKDFERYVLYGARFFPARIRPLRKKSRGYDGLRPNFTAVDEWDSLPSDKIHDQAMSACAGGGGND